MSLWNSLFLGKNYAKLKDVEDKLNRLSDQLEDSSSPRPQRRLPIELAELSPDHPLRQKWERGGFVNRR